MGLAANDVDQARSGMTETVGEILHGPRLPATVGLSGDMPVVAADKRPDMAGIQPDILLDGLHTATAARCPAHDAHPVLPAPSGTPPLIQMGPHLLPIRQDNDHPSRAPRHPSPLNQPAS
ncbi:hypothetical protein ADK75_11840 [Streptomyces virginiae]|uniref:Uncharacterized protein n=1 Tax=Streptomyces virginiae TaxID=1961 RepID=A0A0L8MXN3_STRVG|nr:hypothetical protein ADK75_11840 [Streptomyces virginiae]